MRPRGEDEGGGEAGRKGRKDFTLVSLFLINHNDYK